MSDARAKIYARCIYRGTITIDEIQERYGDDGVSAVKRAYYILYGEEL